MKQTVYIDILLSVNLLTDYFLLRCAAMLSGRTAARARLCLGAAIGAAVSPIILLPPMHRALSLLATSATALAMTLTAFGWGGVRRCLKTTGCLVLATLCWGGIMSCVWTFVSPCGIIVNNGTVYIDIDPRLLVLCAVVFYAAASVLSKRLRRRNMERSSCRLRITYNGNTAETDAVTDTGNMLREPFSGLPVIVVAECDIEGLLPERFGELINGATEQAPCGLRVVPYSSLGGSGLLPAFRPDSISVIMPDGTVMSALAYIAVSEQSDAHRAAIINPDAILG